MVNKKLFESLQEIADVRGLEFEDLLIVLRDSLAACAKHALPAGDDSTIRVDFNVDGSEYHIYKEHKVVETLSENVEEGEIAEITLEDAKKIKRSAKIGDIVSEEMNPKDEEFTRSVIRSVLSTFKSNLKNLERQKSYEYFKKFENEMVNADVTAKNDKFLTLSLGMGVTTILPIKELLPNDSFEVGDRIKVYVKEVEKTTKDPKIKVSRTDRNLITRLMEEYIPEVKNGIIEIKGIARDAGDRSKVAIRSVDPNVDAIGSCVGEKGNRINSIVSSLNGEKIDLYKYSSVPEELIANSLQPATVLAVIDVDPKAKTSLAIVPDDQLSLAIGKQGQNVRLAVQSCGWKIDIKSESDAKAEGRSF
jgi:N utilization substance protein A